MKLTRLDRQLDVVIDGVRIDDLPNEKKDAIRQQLADILRKSQPKTLQYIALMMICEYGVYEGNVRVLPLHSQNTIVDLDNIPITLDLFLKAGIRRGYAHRFMGMASILNCETLGDLFRATPQQLACVRWVGKRTIEILKDFFDNKYGMKWN